VVQRDPLVHDCFGFLASWYSARCDGEWEHEFGVRLETIDNPGWNLQVDLVGTEMEGRVVDQVTQIPEGGGWVIIASDGSVFEASCDPMSLRLVVHEFEKFVREVRQSDG